MFLRDPKFNKISSYNSMGLIVTIIMLFILSGSSAFLINIANLNLKGLDQIIQGKRGNYATLAGIEWGLVYIYQHQSCFEPTTINIDQAGIQKFSVNISCIDIGNKFTLRTQAIYGSASNLSYVNKEIEVNYLKQYIL